MFLHDLTEQIPKTIYLNHEQRPLPKNSNSLEQSRIDLAFKSKVRVSNNRTVFENNEICLVNGKFTDQLGVIEIQGKDNEKLRVTNIERTLIDATVRPVYSGGVGEVLKAFKLAKDKLSNNKLNQIL